MSSKTIIAALQTSLTTSSNHTLFEQAQRNITGIELDQLSRRCAFRLDAIGIKPQDNIGILLPRGIDASIAIYGILTLAACYVPIDMQNPVGRQRFIIKDANCRCVIGQGSCPDWIAESLIEYLDIEEILISGHAISTESERDDQANAAILYTSGSTGTPKGVVLSHRAIMSFVNWSANTFSIDSRDRIASLTPFHFDLSLFDLFTGPISGATTVFIPENLKLAPSRLTDWLIQKKITTWYTVPSILSFLLFKGGLADKDLNDLRQVLFAGEVFASSKLKQLTERLEKTRFYNLFGPTETNVCLYWPVQTQLLESDKPIPIGHPACEAKLKVSTENQELLVKGPCLMNGYWKNSDTSLPLDELGWYHTGDIVCINDQDEYEYHGRLDRMIKHAGYRIEPEEIEAAFNTIEGVRSAAVIGLPDPVSGTQIVAVIAGSRIEQMQLRKQISQLLPGYMQPSRYFITEKLPILSNGKTDYHSLKTKINNRDFR